MEIRLAIKYFIYFLTLTLWQILIFNNIAITSYNFFPNVFVLFLLLLPFDIPIWGLLLISFITGLIIDGFQNTIAISTISFLFIAYIRNFIIKILRPREGYLPYTTPSFYYYGFRWFIIYSSILVFIFQLIFNILIYFNISFTRAIFNAFIDLILSIFFIFILHILFYKNKV